MPSILNNPEPTDKQTLMDKLQFLGQMASTETALFHQKAAAKNGLGITDMKTLSTLLQEGDMTAGQLAERLSLTTGAVTNVIDRLEKKHFVVRKHDLIDRRRVIVQIDPNRADETGKVYDSVGNSFQKLLQDYTIDELQFLVAYYEASIEITKAEISRLSNESY